MLAYRVTGDEQYREWGWQIFESFQKHCRVKSGGYVGIEDVQQVPPKQIDQMETFWLGETLSEFQFIYYTISLWCEGSALDLGLGLARELYGVMADLGQNTFICCLTIRTISH